jgi:hypothetical protein
MAIIDKINLSRSSFEAIVKDMLVDFVGEPKSVTLGAQEIIERKYSN